MKPFLLTMGDGYYPQSGTADWKGCFATYEEAKAQVSEAEGRYILAGDRPGYKYDWFDIIDLREWMNK